MIKARCSCGMTLSARDEFAGKRGVCPFCGRTVQIPAPEGVSPFAAAPLTAGEMALGGGSFAPPKPPRIAPAEEPLDVIEFLDPPAAPIEPPPPKVPWSHKMMQALLDPRSIQWLLTLGGGLMVVGIIIWLYSLGIFENQWVVAVALGAVSLAVHGSGCYVALKTRFKTAGRALTFLGCIVLPLNVWYYQHAGLLRIEDHLWVGVFVCCLIYAATVYLLRDPLFMYAVEGGLTLTLVLLLAALGQGPVDSVTALSLSLLCLALVSIHAERAFPPDAATFNRQRFGMPLFWSGHVQLAAALVFLVAAQLLRWFEYHDTTVLLGLEWSSTLLAGNWWLAGSLWLAGAYAYVYSDVVVRKVGVYTYLAAVCLIMAELSLVGLNIRPEIAIVVISLTGVAISVLRTLFAEKDERLSRTLPPLALILSALALAIGVGVHLLATSPDTAEFFGWTILTEAATGEALPKNAVPDAGWWFVLAMIVAAAASRLSAFIERNAHPQFAFVYFFFSAASVVVAVAGLLRNMPGLQWHAWHQQAPVLMLIPIVYLAASYVWRTQPQGRPLLWVAHTAAAVIGLGAIAGSIELNETALLAVQPRQGNLINLLLGIVFVEATAFYVTAAVMRKHSINVYLAAFTACGAIWQFVGYSQLPSDYYTLLFAAVGIGLTGLARMLGVKETTAYNRIGEKLSRLEGGGVAAYQSATAILAMAFLAALLQGLSRLVTSPTSAGLTALALTTVAGGVAICLAPRRAERWLHATATIALACLTFFTLTWLVQLSAWQKFEIFAVTVGVLMLAASYIGRFREEKGEDDSVSVGLWLGSLLAAGSLTIAVMHHRWVTGPSLYDELALVTVTVLMLATGCGLQFKAPTIIGGSALGLYLVVLIGHLAWFPNVFIGVYLAIGGAVLFGAGVALSMYREKLLMLPEKFARREGLFRVIAWR